MKQLSHCSERRSPLERKGTGSIIPTPMYLLNNLANLYSDQGKNEEAEPLYQRALAIKEKMLGPEHPHTKSTRQNYAALLEKMRQTITSDVPKTNTNP